MPAIAYNPSDPTQNAFLSALALGETGTTPWSTVEGVGGVNLSNAPRDQYGFPLWSGNGQSHAAGTYQFQPATWDAVAAEHGLDFHNPADQNAAAWYLAQDTYAQKTGGKSLNDALAAGDYASVQSALKGVWPSVAGNSSTPGLATAISKGLGAILPSVKDRSISAPSSGSGGIAGSIENFFERFGLIVVGGLIVIVALWQLLSNSGAVPSPATTVKAAGKAAVAVL